MRQAPKPARVPAQTRSSKWSSDRISGMNGDAVELVPRIDVSDRLHTLTPGKEAAGRFVSMDHGADIDRPKASRNRIPHCRCLNRVDHLFREMGSPLAQPVVQRLSPR